MYIFLFVLEKIIQKFYFKLIFTLFLNKAFCLLIHLRNPQEYGNIKRQREKDKESATSRPSFVDGSRRSLQTDGLPENSGNVEEPLLPTGETPPVTPLRKSENVDTETSKSLNDSGHEADSETQKPNKGKSFYTNSKNCQQISYI